MFNLVLKLSFLLFVISTSNVDLVEDYLLTKLINAFDDETTIKDWMVYTDRRITPTFDLFKGILNKIKDVLSVINTKKNADLKSLIMKTDMDLDEVGYPYIESCNILKPLKRILKTNESVNLYDDVANHVQSNFKEFLYRELEEIYEKLSWTIIKIGHKYNNRKLWGNTKAGMLHWAVSDFGKMYEAKIITQNLLKTKQIINLSNELLESILPVSFKIPVFVKSSSKGFKSSRKCYGDGIYHFIKTKSTGVCYGKMLRYSMRLKKDEFCEPRIVDLNVYNDKSFICNRTTTKLLISLFHYYSEFKQINTSYEIFLRDNDEFELKWSLKDISPIQEIKRYWFKKKVRHLSIYKETPDLAHVVKCGENYCTEKSDNTENEGIKTRLILLSCQHRLGFDLIDEFFEKYYNFETQSATCHKCYGWSVDIIGSYDAVVYKCK